MTPNEKDNKKSCFNAGTLGNHGARIVNLEDSDGKQWLAINNLRNRLPNWWVLVIAGMAGALGWVVQIAFG